MGNTNNTPQANRTQHCAQPGAGAQNVNVTVKTQQWTLIIERTTLSNIKNSELKTRVLAEKLPEPPVLSLGYAVDSKSRPITADPIPADGYFQLLSGSQTTTVQLQHMLNAADLKAIAIWVEDYAEYSIIDPDLPASRELATGRLTYKTADLVLDQCKHTITLKLAATISPLQFIVNEMRNNPNSADGKIIKAYTDKADQLYNQLIKNRIEPEGYNQNNLISGEPSLETIGMAGVTDSNYTLHKHGYLLNRGRDGNLTGNAANLGNYYFLKALDQYVALREQAKTEWAGRVHTNDDSLVSGGMDWYLPGSPKWDHKPRLNPIWGAFNRLGNQPYYLYYDIWSNMHYGYVGKQLGFTKKELLDGSGLQQLFDALSEDDPRDVQSMTEGYNLGIASTSSVLTITEKYKAKWGGDKPYK